MLSDKYFREIKYVDLLERRGEPEVFLSLDRPEWLAKKVRVMGGYERILRDRKKIEQVVKKSQGRELSS